MTLHVTVLGIDGSGKSTIAAALPVLLAARFRVISGSVGDVMRVVAPDEDFLAPGFHPDGLPLSARLAKRFRRRAKEHVDDRRRYPIYKLIQMLLQDGAARTLGRRYGVDVLVSDGNTLLSATGRAGNYRRPASERADREMPKPTAEDLLAVFRYVLDDTPLPQESAARLPSLDNARTIKRALKWLGLESAWLPDMVLFLDLPPEEAIERIAARGARVDKHENLDDLRQAREMYLKTLEAFAAYRSFDDALHLPIQGRSPGEILDAALAWIETRLPDVHTDEGGSSAPLGTTSEDLSTKGLLSKVFNYRYLVHYLAAKCFEGAWREPLFALSRPGRQFLKEGYSAAVMRTIYDRHESESGFMQSVFHDYPLHRAVYDRLRILTREIEPELVTRLAEDRPLSLFTAPSGYAYDLFRPLESIASRAPAAMKRVHLMAADLDPYERIESELRQQAERLGIQFRFVRGDLSAPEVRRQFEEQAPFDIALFVGLSSWLPKPEMLSHLSWLHERLRADGVLVTDSFTPAAYALSGKYVGYKASYYEPSLYRCLMDFCGFDGLGASVESGRDAINHVMLFRRRC